MGNPAQPSHRRCVSSMLSPASSSQYLHAWSTRRRDSIAKTSAFRLHSDGSLPYPSVHDSHLAGLCSGALAAAAISTSSSLSDLIPVAVRTVALALHLGLRASEMAESLQGSDTRSTWSMVIPGLTADSASEVLHDFCLRNVRSVSPQPIEGPTNTFT
jgi:hypothetical protein